MAGGVRVVPMENHNDAKSVGSYRSTHTTRSSVLERAREYNRRIDEQKSRRAKSLERQSEGGDDAMSAASGTPRSMSAGRVPSNFQGNRPATRERAMASVNRDTNLIATTNPTSNRSQDTTASDHRSFSSNRTGGSPHNSNMEPTPRSRVSGASAYSSHVSRPEPTTPRMSGGHEQQQQPARNHVPTPSHQPRSRHQAQNISYNLDSSRSSAVRSSVENTGPAPRDSPSRSIKSSQPNNNNARGEENHEAVVTPELLVDALSGHEDGLLAIAERLMEHYDSGYDVMGEAIIDAFADVQKLFQHVVEAAHMEGAAFEASRKEEEIAELRKQAAAAGALNDLNTEQAASPSGPPGPTRHDEFVDQDVKDILTEAIRKGTNYRNTNKFSECYQLYEQACQSASALLPVDSDHRGRLQLSIARAESMNHERACAILRYAMDDVLRSGLRAGSVPLPDPSQRADVVLNRPKGVVTGSTGVQSSEEALNSLVEEMREVLQAPVYNNTPLQSVAERFLAALAEAQKAQQKNEEKLEQNLAKLKGDFLLARAEWEEKLNSTQETAEVYKEKYQKLKESIRRGEGGSDPNNTSMNGSTYFDHARSALASQQQRVRDEEDTYAGYSIRSSASRAGSHAGSLGSGLANHARSIVGSFACAGGNARSGGVVAQELAEHRDAEIREMAFRHDSGSRDRDRRGGRRQSGHQSISQSYSDRSFSSESQPQTPRGQPRINTNNHTPHSVASGSVRSKSSRSFREYSRSPQRVDF